MKTVCNENMCNGCMVCVDKCPRQCISIKDSVFAFNAIRETDNCVECGACEKVCPRNTQSKKSKPISWYQGWAEKQIRIEASSGGAASAIMKCFIQNNGYVASCLFKEGKFLFDITNDVKIAKRFAGSKYVKSNPAGIYRIIKERLKTDRVLFIGLPCQVAGLKNYIGENNNLYTIDLICHGTPSPKVLVQFLREHSIDIREIKDIKFRDSVSMGIVSNGEKICPEGIDDYLLAFLDAVNYTENCYNCDYATIERISDVTLGDSWGTEYTEEIRNGVSLILVNTQKGEELLSKLDFNLKPVNFEKAIASNDQLRHPSVLNPNREKYLNMLKSGKSISYASFALYKKTIIRRNIKKLLIKLHLRKPGGGTALL